MLVEHKSSFQLHNARGWSQMAGNPVLNRTLLRQTAWTWSLHGGQLRVVLAGTAYSFSLGASGGGLGFSSDELRAASSLGDSLFVMSRAFLEVAHGSSDLGTLSAQRLAPRSSTGLESLIAADGSVSLFEHEGNILLRWDPATLSFATVSAGSDPRRLWRLVNQPRLRLTRLPSGVRMELRLDEPSGVSRWASFHMDVGRFPFDVVDSFAADCTWYTWAPMLGWRLSTKACRCPSEIDKLYD